VREFLPVHIARKKAGLLNLNPIMHPKEEEKGPHTPLPSYQREGSPFDGTKLWSKWQRIEIKTNVGVQLGTNPRRA
jgi:hypothetical protein